MSRTIPEAIHELCLSLPDTEKVSRHGAQALYTELDPESYFVPPYVGVKGWLGMELNKNLGWAEIQARVRESYAHASSLAPSVPLDQLPVVDPPEIEMRPEDINPWLGTRAPLTWLKLLDW